MTQLMPEHILQMIRVNRHDWLNHIQVLDGFVKLGNYSEVKQYLDRLTDQLLQEQLLSQIGNTDLILYLLTFPSRYPNVQFEIQMSEVIRFDQTPMTEEHIRYFIQLLDGIAVHSDVKNEIHPSLLVSMGTLDNKIKLEIDYVGGFAQNFTEQLRQLINTWKTLGASITEKEVNDDEFLIEIVMG